MISDAMVEAAAEAIWRASSGAVSAFDWPRHAGADADWFRGRARATLTAAFAAADPCEHCRASREQFSIIANYLLGQGEGEGRDPDECRALATNEALAAFDRLDAQDGTP